MTAPEPPQKKRKHSVAHRAEYALARTRVEEAGLQEQVTVLQRDYRDLDGQYDRLVSIEAVGTVTSGPATVYRLHLPGGGFFQIHLGPDGQPDVSGAAHDGNPRRFTVSVGA